MIKGVDHIAIAVRNLDEWVDMFNRLFGLRVSISESVADQGVKMAALQARNTLIEFMQPADAASPLTRFVVTRGEALHHLCFEVEDVRREMKAVADKGFLLASSEPMDAVLGWEVFIRPRSTKGLLLEMGQKTPAVEAALDPKQAKTAKRVDHIAIAVRNLDEWLTMFNQLFGVRPSAEGRRPGPGVSVAFLTVGDTSFEFMQPTEPSALTRFLETKGEGVHHICFEVDDVEGEIQALESKGFQIASRETRPGGSMKLAFIHPKTTKGLLLQIGQKIK